MGKIPVYQCVLLEEQTEYLLLSNFTEDKKLMIDYESQINL